MVVFEYVYIFMFIFIYLCFGDAVKIAFSANLLLKFRQFLTSYSQESHISYMILQDQTISLKIFEDSCKNKAMSSKILEMKSDRFLQEMYGSSTGENTNNVQPRSSIASNTGIGPSEPNVEELMKSFGDALLSRRICLLKKNN